MFRPMERTGLSACAATPPHVPARLVRDFDLYARPGVERDFHGAWLEFQAQAAEPIVWTARHGGHWILLDGTRVMDAYADFERLSSKVLVVPRPVTPPENGAVSYDPPQHGDFRMLINDGLSPRAVRGIEPQIRELARGLIEGLVARGECELQRDFAEIVPLIVFLRLADLPLADRAMLSAWTKQITHPDGELDHDEVMARFIGYLQPIVAARRGGAGNDMITRIASGTVFGRPIEDAEAIGACAHLMMAGLDTVASFLGFVMRHLAEHAEDRQRLVRDGVSPTAVAELIRRFPLVTIMRLARCDLDIAGVTVKAGELVALPSALYNLDEKRFADPLAVDFTRRIDPSCTFGNGVHRCPGSNLARAEVRIILEEWLRLIPDFTVAPDAPPTIAGGFVGTVSALHLRWEPIGVTLHEEVTA